MSTITTFRPLSVLSEGLGNLVTRFAGAGRHEELFSLSDAQLAARGYSRDGLMRSFMAGRGHQ